MATTRSVDHKVWMGGGRCTNRSSIFRRLLIMIWIIPTLHKHRPRCTTKDAMVVQEFMIKLWNKLLLFMIMRDTLCILLAFDVVLVTRKRNFYLLIQMCKTLIHHIMDDGWREKRRKEKERKIIILNANKVFTLCSVQCRARILALTAPCGNYRRFELFWHGWVTADGSQVAYIVI